MLPRTLRRISDAGPAFAQVMRWGKWQRLSGILRYGESHRLVKAFALSDDIKSKRSPTTSIKKMPGGVHQAHEVSSRFIGQQREGFPRSEVVGLAECQKAKLKVPTTDLFGTQHLSRLKTLRRPRRQKAAEALRRACE